MFTMPFYARDVTFRAFWMPAMQGTIKRNMLGLHLGRRTGLLVACADMALATC